MITINVSGPEGEGQVTVVLDNNHSQDPVVAADSVKAFFDRYYGREEATT